MRETKAMTRENEEDQPSRGGDLRPPAALIACSLFVIGWSMWIAANVIADMVVGANFMLIPGLLVMGPLLVVLVAFQYLGTFRGDPSAASGVRVLYYVLGGGAFLMATVTAGKSLDEPRALALMGSYFATLLAFAVGAAVIGWQNGRWARRLRSDATREGCRVGWRDITKRDLLVFAGILAAIGILTVSFAKTSPPRFAEHVEAAEAPVYLPEGATEVSYARGAFSGEQAYEFTTDEASFRSWVESGIGSIESQVAGVPMREIGEPYTITRYFFYAPELRQMAEESGADRLYYQKTIAHGLYYEWTREDRGVYAVYDRTTGRAYYSAHSR